MSNPTYTCEMCAHVVEGADMDEFVAALTTHARDDHQWPYPDIAIRNFGYATQRATGPKERLESIGDVEIHRVTEDRLDDWTRFFDVQAFPDNFAWASCYCSEPHCLDPKAPDDDEGRPFEESRAITRDLLSTGRSYGYLAYVDGVAAGWVNASLRSEYALYRRGEGADPADEDVIGIACFVVAPPYRGHGLAPQLLDRVIEDAPGRGARWIEAYPFTDDVRKDAMADFRGHPSMYEARGFEVIKQLERHVVVRRAV